MQSVEYRRLGSSGVRVSVPIVSPYVVWTPALTAYSAFLTIAWLHESWIIKMESE